MIYNILSHLYMCHYTRSSHLVITKHYSSIIIEGYTIQYCGQQDRSTRISLTLLTIRQQYSFDYNQVGHHIRERNTAISSIASANRVSKSVRSWFRRGGYFAMRHDTVLSQSVSFDPENVYSMSLALAIHTTAIQIFSSGLLSRRAPLTFVEARKQATHVGTT